MRISFRHSWGKLHGRTDSMDSQPDTPLLREEAVEDTQSGPKTKDGNTQSKGLDEERMVTHSHDTMLDLISQKVRDKDVVAQYGVNEKQKADLLHFGSEQNMSALQDLSHMLYTRGRLQELGCTFTKPGELLTYGHPATLQESQQLLRLGPMYDQQWSLFFQQSALCDLKEDMWADMRTLKRVLTNEGVEFGQNHRRLTFGDGSSKLHRLCTAYDNLYKLWSARLPERALSPHQEEELSQADVNDDSGCFMEHEIDLGAAVQETVVSCPPKGNAVVNGLPFGNAAGGDVRHMEFKTRPGSAVPRNLGWRFRDDIDMATAARYRDSLDLSDNELDAMEASLAMAVRVALPNDHSRQSSPVQTEALDARSSSKTEATLSSMSHPIVQTRHRYGQSPLQAVTTIGMVCVDERKGDTRWEDTRASRIVDKGDLREPEANKAKQGLRGWARAVWTKAWSPMQDAQQDAVGQVGGWW